MRKNQDTCIDEQLLEDLDDDIFYLADEIEGYDQCTQSKRKCFIDCQMPLTSFPTIATLN